MTSTLSSTMNPFQLARKELKEQLDRFATTFEAKMDAVVEMLNRHPNVMYKKVDLLIEKTIPESRHVSLLVQK
ncbi:hypothetical protein RB195_007186 [Necator americanus]|uniref:Uncharacterized protein n=1 Tax=Necator americanus TaxID=51031 RepID=A0ABR1BXE1_NECAM